MAKTKYTVGTPGPSAGSGSRASGTTSLDGEGTPYDRQMMKKAPKSSPAPKTVGNSGAARVGPEGTPYDERNRRRG